MAFYFPLFNDLKKNDTTPLFTDENLLEYFKMYKQDENIYLLMRAYEQESTGKIDLSKLPFDGKQLKNSVRFNVEKFPSELKRLLFIYFSMKE